MSPLLRRAGRFPGLLLALTLILLVGDPLARLRAAEHGQRLFALPAGGAEVTLEAFSEQAGVQIVYLLEDVRGVATNAVRGDFAMREALDRLVAGTGLVVMQDEKSGAFALKRERRAPSSSAPQPSMKSKNPFATLTGWLALLVAPGAHSQVVSSNASPSGAAPSADTPVPLDVFTVKGDKDYGYRKSTSITTSRIGVSLTEAPQAIEIVTGEMLHDLDISSIRQVFDYTASVTENKQEILQSASYRLRGFALPTFINGLAQAPAPTNPGHISTDNIDRIEIAKGPVGLFYGNSSPNGVANIITKRPQYINKTTVEISGGSFGYEKALIDTQTVVSKDHGIAYRLIAAADKSKTRIDQDTSYNMVAGSVSIRPNDKFQMQVEFNATNFQSSYMANNAWNFMVNPLYYQQVNNPPRQMLDYVKAKYGAATDAAALTVISNRWGKNGPTSFLSNWAADYFGAYGSIQYPETGTTVNWNAISPWGDKFTGAGPDSNDDGTTYLTDASLTFTPLRHTAIQYHWVHNANRQNFARQLFGYNSGPLDAQGHFPSLTIGADSRQRNTDSDAQQLDLSQEVSFAGIRNRLIGGVELRRDVSNSGSAPIDRTKAPTRTLPDGTKQSLADFFFPFTDTLYPLSTTVAGAIVVPNAKPNEYQDWYASYRGSGFENKVNFLAGVRNVKLQTTGQTASGQNKLTKTFGLIGQVQPGLFLFGSYNTDFVFSQGFTVNFLGNGQPVPGEGAALGPESGKGLELGTKLTLLNDKITGTISYFKIERNGVATNDFLRNASDPRNNDTNSNNDVRFNVNGGLQRTSGFDGDLIWTPNSTFQLVGNFTYMNEAKILSDPSVNITNIGVNEGNARLYDKEFRHRLPKSPRFNANLIGKYNFTSGPLRGTFVGGAIRRSGEYLLSDNTSYDIYVLAETKFDAFAGWSTKVMNVPTTIQLNLQNIGNKINDITRDDGFVARVRVTLQF